MKKVISLLTICTLFLPCLPVSAKEAVREDTILLQDAAIEDTAPYTFYMVPERTYVSAEEVQNGDVHIPTRVYIKGNRTLQYQIAGAGIRYQSDSNFVHFDNSANIFESADDIYKQTYSGGSFLSEYAPCLPVSAKLRPLVSMHLMSAVLFPVPNSVTPLVDLPSAVTEMVVCISHAVTER